MTNTREHLCLSAVCQGFSNRPIVQVRSTHPMSVLRRIIERVRDMTFESLGFLYQNAS